MQLTNTIIVVAALSTARHCFQAKYSVISTARHIYCVLRIRGGYKKIPKPEPDDVLLHDGNRRAIMASGTAAVVAVLHLTRILQEWASVSRRYDRILSSKAVCRSRPGGGVRRPKGCSWDWRVLGLASIETLALFLCIFAM